ncbi:MAG: ATP synthase F0 subunit B [bacterium]
MSLILIYSEESVKWWNYPGLELWKFLNLFLFLGVLVYFLRRRMSDAFRGRRDAIREDLLRAQQERDAALKKLQEVEAKLDRVDVEVLAIKERAEKEAADERERLARSTEADVRKLSEQAQREIASAGKAARQELRRYAAEQTIGIAGEMIRNEIRPEDDARLIKASMTELGGGTN